MVERNVTIDHSTIYRQVRKSTPQLETAFRKGRNSPIGKRWRTDETYIQVKSQWRYLYRAVVQADQTIGFLLTARRIKKVALGFF